MMICLHENANRNKLPNVTREYRRLIFRGNKLIRHDVPL